MVSNAAQMDQRDAISSLEKIKKQLSAGSGRNFLQGPLLKRSETLRKWNERWMILDPTIGKMEYRTKRDEIGIKGTIVFDSSSTITLSPVNFHGLPKYDGCCFYIGTPQKKDYFFCAETPGAAKAWVSTLRATQLVLRAHKEAVKSLSGAGSATLGTVAEAVTAANSVALEASKEIEAAMRVAMMTALETVTKIKPSENQMDDLAVMKETLSVKDEELHHLAKELRARDSTIREIAEKLTDTAEAAEAAASAAHAMDEQRRIACEEVECLKKENEKTNELFSSKVKSLEEQVETLRKETSGLLTQRDCALKESRMWRSELAKAREHMVILEAAVVRAEERARLSETGAEAKWKSIAERESLAEKEKKDLLAYVAKLQAQIQRQQIVEKQFLPTEKEFHTGDDVKKLEADVKGISLQAGGSGRMDIPIDGHGGDT